MTEEQANRLFGVHGDLVDVETCIKQVGKICREVAQPTTDFDNEDFLFFLALTLTSYAEKLSAATDELDEIRRELMGDQI